MHIVRSSLSLNLAHALALAACAAVHFRSGPAVEWALSALGPSAQATVPFTGVALGSVVAASLPGIVPATVATALTSWRLIRDGSALPQALAPGIFLVIAGLFLAGSWLLPVGLAASLLSGMAQMTAILLLGGIALSALAVPSEIEIPAQAIGHHGHVVPFPEAAHGRDEQEEEAIALAA